MVIYKWILDTLQRTRVRFYTLVLLCVLAWVGHRHNKPFLTHLAATTAIASSSVLVTSCTYRYTKLKPLEKRLDTVLLDNSNLTSLRDNLLLQLKETMGKHKTTLSHLDELKHERIRLTNDLKQITRERDDLERRVDSLQNELRVADDRYADDIRELRSENELLNVRLKAQCQPLQERIAELKDKLRAVDKTIAEYDSLLDAKDAEVISLKVRESELLGQIDALKGSMTLLLQPKKLPSGTDLNNFSGRIIDWFLRTSPPIELDALDAKVSKSDWKLRYKLRTPDDKLRLPLYESQLRIDFGLPQVPRFSTKGDEVTLTIYRGEEMAYTSRVRSDVDWLREAFVVELEGSEGRLRTHHARFTGRSGSGKSALVNNLMGVVSGEIPNIQFVLLDPLANSKSSWFREPDAKGREECMKKFMTVYDKFLQREDGVDKDTHPIVLVVDEFDDFSKLEDVLAKAKSIWKRGRHSDIYLWTLGQTSLVGEYGSKTGDSRLTRNDVDNTIGLYISNTIDRGLTDLNVDPETASKLREDWLQNANKRVALVRPATVGKNPFIALMPEPGTFTVLAERTVNDKPVIHTQTILNLHQEGKTLSQIVEQVYGVKRGKSQAYKQAKQEVEAVLQKQGV